MKENEYKAVELSDEQMAQVSGGGPIRTTTGGECNATVELTSDGICKWCYQGNPCYYCRFRASWCQELNIGPDLSAPDDVK